MEKLYVLFVLVLVANQALCMSLRLKRQSEDEDLEDRYGWNRPAQRPVFPGLSPGQGQFPDQSQSTDQSRFPSLGQFPGQGQFPNQGQFPGQNQQQQTSTTTAPSRTTTVSAAIQQCMRSCSVTSEYNPVCGSDNQTYSNPGRLTCAQQCGTPVTQVRSSPCPTTTPAPMN